MVRYLKLTYVPKPSVGGTDTKLTSTDRTRTNPPPVAVITKYIKKSNNFKITNGFLATYSN